MFMFAWRVECNFRSRYNEDCRMYFIYDIVSMFFLCKTDKTGWNKKDLLYG